MTAMKNKKGIIAAVILALTAGGGFFGLKAYNRASQRASVVPVEMLNSMYYEEGMSMYGTIYDSDSQNVYLSPTSIISKIHVSEGQQVAKGDPLISFDMTSQQLTLEMKQLAVEKLQNELAEARNELILLQNAKPYVEPAPEPEPEILPDPEPEPEPSEEPGPVIPEGQKDGEAWTVLRHMDQNLDDACPEYPAAVYHYLLTQDGILCGSFFNELKAMEEPTQAVLEVREGNTHDGALITAWLISSRYITVDYSDDDCWYIMSHDAANGSGAAVIDGGYPGWNPGGQNGQAVTPEGPGTPGTSSKPASYDGMYTKEELAEMIKSQRQTIRDLDLQLRRAQLDLKIMKDEMSDGTVYARKDGVVRTLGDPSAPPQDGSPFMTVASGSGITIRAAVSELMLDQIKIGLPVTVTSFDTGDVFEAKVRSVDIYPTSSNMGGGNPNASYYDFYVYSEEAPSLPAYSYLQLTTGAPDSSADRIVLENMFIRNDSGGSYVMKDEDGRLKKQYVKTGKTYYGYATEIKEGLSIDDSITFPYGPGGTEGTVTEMAEGPEVFWQ